MACDRMQWGAEAWQYADLYMPDDESPYQKSGEIPCVMLIHGGFWKEKFTSELMKPIAEDLAEAGIAAWNIEFKRWKEGDEGVWMDTLSDILRAWGQLALLPNIDVQRTMILGHSSGGHLALLLAAKAERKPWLTIAQAPITDIIEADVSKLSDEGNAVRKWIGCSPQENPKLWDQLNPISNPIDCPTLLVHGKKDTEVPISQSKAYSKMMQERDDEVNELWLPGDHFSVIDIANDDWLVQLNAITDWL